MINQVYQLIAPGVISPKITDISFGEKVIVKPTYMALCHADQRYYLGQRDAGVLKKKLPMALIHECCATVVYDPTGTFHKDEQVVLIPNVPSENNGIIFENYAQGSGFLSSGKDGFMRELVELDADRCVSAEGLPAQNVAITEFVSVAVHAAHRFDLIAHEIRDTIGIWGDGSLAYIVANVLHTLFPKAKIAVVGKTPQKLAHFSFVNKTYFSDDLPDDFKVDHAFECCGGEGSFYAFEDIIKTIRPQGCVMMMGVSENRVPIQTRMVLEKGLTFVGCSRSGRQDFERAVLLYRNEKFLRRLSTVIYVDTPVRKIADIHRVFSTDLTTPFKTVFKWEL